MKIHETLGIERGIKSTVFHQATFNWQIDSHKAADVTLRRKLQNLYVTGPFFIQTSGNFT